jgi:hypothetical protein
MYVFIKSFAAFFVLGLTLAFLLPGCTSCEKGIVNTVAADPATTILAHAGEDDQTFTYTRMSSRYRAAHSQEEFARKIKGIPNVKQLDLLSPANVEGSGARRTIRGDIDVKNGATVKWESVTVMEDEATNAWRCDSLKIGSYVIE